MLGVAPLLGRDFAAGEDAKGGNNQVVILTYDFWQGHFGGEAGVVGKTLMLNQLPYTVTGEVRPAFVGAGQPWGTTQTRPTSKRCASCVA